MALGAHAVQAHAMDMVAEVPGLMPVVAAQRSGRHPGPLEQQRDHEDGKGGKTGPGHGRGHGRSAGLSGMAFDPNRDCPMPASLGRRSDPALSGT